MIQLNNKPHLTDKLLSDETPLIVFHSTGLLDIVEHKVNGYLAKSFDTIDLKDGIEWVLNTPNYEEISINAREKVLKNFDNKIVAQKYIDLYNKVLNDR